MKQLIQSKKTCLMLISCALAVAGCASTPDEYAAITKAERLLNEWGTASASTPVLHYGDEHYKFGEIKTDKEFFKAAKEESNAGIARHEQMITSVFLSASAQFDPLNQELVQSQLEKFRSANESQPAAELTEAQQTMIETNQEYIADQAKSNYLACLAAADAEMATAKTLTDQAQILALNDSAIARRKTCLDDYQATIFPVATQPGELSLPENNVPALNRIQTTPFAGKSDLSTPWGDAEKSPLSEVVLPDHQALAQAATNNFLNGMFTTLSESQGESMFGVTMVAVNPGWRTRENHKAVINIAPKLTYRAATRKGVEEYLSRKDIDKDLRAAISLIYDHSCKGKDYEAICSDDVADGDTESPQTKLAQRLEEDWEHDTYNSLIRDSAMLTAIALSPISYAQNMDLHNRRITQLNLSLMLAASLREAGAEQAAEIFADFSRKQQKDFISKNALNSVNIFSYGSYMFGVEVGPEFVAATEFDGDPELRLQKQSFPVLVKFQIESKKNFQKFWFAEDCNINGNKLEYCLVEARLKVETTHRWQPLKRRFTDFLSPSNRFGLSTAQLMEVKNGLTSSLNTPLNNDEFYKNRVYELRKKLLGTYEEFTIPAKKPTPPKVPSINYIYPTAVTLDKQADGKTIKPKDVKFVVSGKHFAELATKSNPTDVKAALSPLYAGQTIKSADLVGNSILLEMQISDNKGPVGLVITHNGKQISGVNSPNTLAQLKVKGAPPPARTSTVYEVQAQKDGQTLVTLPPGKSDLPANITKVIEGVVKGAKPKGKTTTNTNTTTSAKKPTSTP